MIIYVTIHECCLEVNHSAWYMIISKVNSIIHESSTPFLHGTHMQIQMNFICSQSHVLLESLTGLGL